MIAADGNADEGEGVPAKALPFVWSTQWQLVLVLLFLIIKRGQ